MKKFLFSILLSYGCFAQKCIIIDSIAPSSVCAKQWVHIYVHTTGTWFATDDVTNYMDIGDCYSHNYGTNGAGGNWTPNYKHLQDSGFVWNYYVSQPLACTFHVYACGISGPVTINNCYYDIREEAPIENKLKTEYFNLMGQPIAAPEDICVEITTYTSGLKHARKIFASN